jgi:hypothetical protein
MTAAGRCESRWDDAHTTRQQNRTHDDMRNTRMRFGCLPPAYVRCQSLGRSAVGQTHKRPSRPALSHACGEMAAMADTGEVWAAQSRICSGRPRWASNAPNEAAGPSHAAGSRVIACCHNMGRVHREDSGRSAKWRTKVFHADIKTAATARRTENDGMAGSVG